MSINLPIKTGLTTYNPTSVYTSRINAAPLTLLSSIFRWGQIGRGRRKGVKDGGGGGIRQQIDKHAIWAEGLGIEWKLKMIGAYLCLTEGELSSPAGGIVGNAAHIRHDIGQESRYLHFLCGDPVSIP